MRPVLEQFQKFLCAHSYCGWLLIVLIALILAFIIKLIIGTASKRLHKIAIKTPTIWDTVVLELFDNLRYIVLSYWIFFVLAKSMEQTEFLTNGFRFFLVVLTSYQVSIWGLHLLKNWHADVLAKKMAKDPSSSGALGLLYRFVQAAFVVLLILIALSNLNINVGALLAGLGVGGIAVALAAQNVLGDLLASLSIVLDKPFCVGDYIRAGNESGTVEYIGVRTTRLRSLSGEQLVIPNRNLLESRVQNYKRMQRRRSLQHFSVLYSTSPEIVERIPMWIKAVTDSDAKLQYDRCHLFKFGDSALEFELSFYVLDTNYSVYMTLQQKVLLAILQKFNQEGVHFAFSTHTVYLEK